MLWSAIEVCADVGGAAQLRILRHALPRAPSAVVPLHGALSYDQRSNTRPNLALLEPALRGLRARNPTKTLRVLDYGCGFGTLLLALPRTGFELYAYDLSERAVLQLCAAALSRA